MSPLSYITVSNGCTDATPSIRTYQPGSQEAVAVFEQLIKLATGEQEGDGVSRFTIVTKVCPLRGFSCCRGSLSGQSITHDDGCFSFLWVGLIGVLHTLGAL